MSVCISVWTVAEGGVSSNLGQSTDRKVNPAMEHCEIDTHTDTHKILTETNTHIDTESTHKKKIFMGNMTREKVETHTGDLQVYATYLHVCVLWCSCLCVCVSADKHTMRE